jgi:hypothetical protein
VPPITELTRIEPVHLARLEKQGVFTTGILLEVSETVTRRQTLADQVDADTNDVLRWRDEALLLNLAGFGPEEHQLFVQAGVDGLRDCLDLPLDDFRARLARAATELEVEAPPDLMVVGWWMAKRSGRVKSAEPPLERRGGERRPLSDRGRHLDAARPRRPGDPAPDAVLDLPPRSEPRPVPGPAGRSRQFTR